MHVAAADIQLVQSLGEADVHGVLRRGQDQHQLLVLDIGHTNALEQIGCKIVVYVAAHLNGESGVFIDKALMIVEIRQSQLVQKLRIPLRQPRRRGECKLIDQSHKTNEPPCRIVLGTGVIAQCLCYWNCPDKGMHFCSQLV